MTFQYCKFQSLLKILDEAPERGVRACNTSTEFQNPPIFIPPPPPSSPPPAEPTPILPIQDTSPLGSSQPFSSPVYILDYNAEQTAIVTPTIQESAPNVDDALSGIFRTPPSLPFLSLFNGKCSRKSFLRTVIALSSYHMLKVYYSCLHVLHEIFPYSLVFCQQHCWPVAVVAVNPTTRVLQLGKSVDHWFLSIKGYCLYCPSLHSVGFYHRYRTSMGFTHKYIFLYNYIYGFTVKMSQTLHSLGIGRKHGKTLRVDDSD